MKLQDVERAIAETKAEIALLEGRLVALDALRLQFVAHDSSLSSKMHLENASSKKKATKISARLASKSSKGAKAREYLLKADKTPADIAAELKRARSTVQAWLDGRNAIPKDARDYLRTKYGIPDSAWPEVQD